MVVNDVMVELEKEHVHKVYSEIATHFSDTRYKPWPRIAQFLQQQPPGSLLADVGCGNGKYLGVNSQVYVLGSDICPELVSIGHARGHEVLTCDCLHLPYRSNQFDGLICIAVIHHLSSEDRRFEALTEMARVLRPGGEMLVYVWAMEQERKRFDSQDVMVPWHLQPRYTAGHVGKSADEQAARVRVRKERKRKKQEALHEGRDSVGDDGRSAEGIKERERALPQPEEECGGRRESSSDGLSKEKEALELGGSSSVGTDKCGVTYQRYYHVFRKGELEGLVRRVSTLRVQEEFYDHENWCVLAEALNKTTDKD